jgi:hypothetical protein
MLLISKRSLKNETPESDQTKIVAPQEEEMPIAVEREVETVSTFYAANPELMAADRYRADKQLIPCENAEVQPNLSSLLYHKQEPMGSSHLF